MADTFRVNPAIDVETVTTELAVGEALVSVLQADGTPTPVERAFVLPPHGRIGPLTAEERAAVMAASLVAGVYDTALDRESAEEQLKTRAEAAIAVAAAPVPAPAPAPMPAPLRPRGPFKEGDVSYEGGSGGKSGSGPFRSTGRKDDLFEAFGKSAVRAVGSQFGRQIARGILGTITKGLK